MAARRKSNGSSKKGSKATKKGSKATKKRAKGVRWNPVNCPGNHKDNCDILRAWGLAWEAWGNEVRIALRAVPDSTGGPTNVSPPPPPPYKP
jgi:hypothetical protein